MIAEFLNYLPLILFQIFLTGVMTVLINSFGIVSKGYVTMDQLLSNTNLGYNIFYRILSPTVFISFATLILYQLGFPQLTLNIWLIPVYFLIFNFIILNLLSRFPLVNKPLYILIHLLSIGIAFWVYENALKYGPEAILPDPGNFRTELWFIIIAYFYSLLNNFNPDYAAEENRKNKFVNERYKNLKKKYGKFLKDEFRNNELLKRILFSIMINEDINRPPVFRFFERLLFPFGFIKTTGIMQVTSKKLLSDSESISKAQKIILDSYLKHLAITDNEYELIIRIGNDYNRGGYGVDIGKYYWTLKNLNL